MEEQSESNPDQKSPREAEFEPRMDESSPEHEGRSPSPQYIKEEFEAQVPEPEAYEVREEPAQYPENREGSFERYEPPPPLDLSSKLHLSSVGPPRQAKYSMAMGGESPKLGARRSPLKKRVDERPGITKEEEYEFKELFDLLDYNKKGVVEPREIMAVLKSNKWHEKNPMLFALISELDTEENRDGITFQQFLNAFTIDLVGNTSRDHITNLFKMVDEDGSGSIKLEDLRRIVKEVGETVSSEELREMIKKVGNGEEITFNEFYSVMARKLA